MSIINLMLEWIKEWVEEQEKVCPRCGYYCTGKTVHCLQPIEDEKTQTN